MIRKDVIATGEIYHIFTKSIAGFKVFNNDFDYERMRQLIQYYQINNNRIRYSDFIKSSIVNKQKFREAFGIISQDKENIVQIIAFCLMPTHIHLVLKQLSEKSISEYMKNILASYSMYFNNQHKRNGPLWESRFKNVLLVSDEQLLHLTRYIHLNPVTAKLINKPEDWEYSSYKEYLGKGNNTICQYADLIDIKPSQYQKFVNDQISYQRELSIIKKLILD